jgi:flavodoxin
MARQDPRPHCARQPGRRTVLRGALALGAGALAAVPLSGCTPREGKTVSSPTDQPSTPRSLDSGTPGPGVLLAYFSRAGENYRYGGRVDLKVGNTQVVADMISARAVVDVYRIEAADPYPDDYDETVARNVQEEEADARPKIAGSLPSLHGYERILLGSPVWNVQEPMIMRTFIEALDWTGKTVHPFVTFAVSGMGRVQDDYTRLLPAATVNDGLAVQGETVRDSLSQIRAWLRRIDLA